MGEQYFGCCHLQTPCLNPNNKPEGLRTDALKGEKKRFYPQNGAEKGEKTLRKNKWRLIASALWSLRSSRL